MDSIDFQFVLIFLWKTSTKTLKLIISFDLFCFYQYKIIVKINKKICFVFCFQEHVHEVLSKWESIDDEIWAKIIVLVNLQSLIVIIW
jgi:hypothetical protein